MESATPAIANKAPDAANGWSVAGNCRWHVRIPKATRRTVGQWRRAYPVWKEHGFRGVASRYCGFYNTCDSMYTYWTQRCKRN